MSTKVLVVEDDLEINELLGEYLGLEGISYVQATTGEAGIHVAGREHPDAVILDLMLPDIDGFEVARRISMHRATFDIPIIILSCMCHDCDKEKAHGSGALFFMNKPFLPDDLIATVKQALEWKRGLESRAAAGTVVLGDTRDGVLCQTAIGQMVADLFARTDLPDGAVAQIKEAMETMGGWAKQWNVDHGVQGGGVKLEYRIGPGDKGKVPTVEWKLTEDLPGMLAEAFFAEPVESASGGGGGIGWGGAASILGWGASALATRAQATGTTPIAPPAKWMEVLAKTGAARLEKDSKAHVIRFSRAGVQGAAVGNGPVPVVEIDGARYPTRLRDEALAAKRK